MKAERKIMEQRLEALQLSEIFGNVSRVCRERGISRTQFTSIKEGFKPMGLKA